MTTRSSTSSLLLFLAAFRKYLEIRYKCRSTSRTFVTCSWLRTMRKLYPRNDTCSSATSITCSRISSLTDSLIAIPTFLFLIQSQTFQKKIRSTMDLRTHWKQVKRSIKMKMITSNSYNSDLSQILDNL